RANRPKTEQGSATRVNADFWCLDRACRPGGRRRSSRHAAKAGLHRQPPVAGRGDGARLAGPDGGAPGGGGDFGTYFTKRPNEATDLTRHALERGADVVVAVGGDGTTNEVVNGFFDERGELVRPGAALAVLPRGTGSDFLKSFTVDRSVEA